MPSPTNHRLLKKAGFTLLEMAMVLAIISLIIGGIIAAQSLQQASKIQATLGQLEGFRNAVNTFQVMYGSLPGDTTTAQIQKYNLPTCSGCGGMYYGSGKLANVPTNTSLETILQGKQNLFWVQLSAAKLIPYSFTDTSYTISATAAQVDLKLPAAKMGGENHWMVIWNQGRNYYWLQQVLKITGGIPTAGGVITPQQALIIDSKIDDGLPQTGSVNDVQVGSHPTCIAYDNVTTWAEQCYSITYPTPAIPCAVTSGSSKIYNITRNNRDLPSCGLTFNFQ
jgi:prepilin-type N-terminal cleavage/methylation domain-containing protein